MADQSERRGFTPGPHWTTNGHTNGAAIHARTEDGLEVETAFCQNPGDAALYAAAPDLYEALQEAVKWIKESAEGEAATRMALDALAKADGRDTGGEHE